jgi:hypothetical protein
MEDDIGAMSLVFPLPGGCNCGAVRYEIGRAPIATYICHCHLCQKRTGGAFSLSAVFPADALEFMAGEPVRTERVLPSGLKNTSFICGACHSRIHTLREGLPTLNLRIGTLDDTSWVRPVAQIWTSSAMAWALVPDILSYEEQPADFGAVLTAAKALTAAATAPDET